MYILNVLHQIFIYCRKIRKQILAKAQLYKLKLLHKKYKYTYIAL